MAVINPGAYGNNALPIYQYPNTATPTINPPAYTGTAFGQQPQEQKSNTMIFVRGINEALNYPAGQPIRYSTLRISQVFECLITPKEIKMPVILKNTLQNRNSMSLKSLSTNLRNKVTYAKIGGGIGRRKLGQVG